MIEANELRIGNLIERRDEAGIVCSIDREHVWLQLGGEWGDMERWLHESVEPIPLTPDILEKCGFEKRQNKSLEVVMIGNDGRGIERWVDKVSYGKNYMHLREERGKYYFVDRPGCEVKHLHQLQNLYFALTGQELEVKV